jgi:hypothetical protein
MKTAFAVALLFAGLLAWEDAPQRVAIKATGTVKHQGLEGGFWGIVGDDGQNYDPVNLAPEFQKEGLRVSFEAVPAQNQMSIHMWGTIVELKTIARLKNAPPPGFPGSAKPASGLCNFSLPRVREAAKAVLSARGDTLLAQEDSLESLLTKPRSLDQAALLASCVSRDKPEASGYTEGTCALAIALIPLNKSRTKVEVRAKILAFGTPDKAMARPSTWDPVPSNGKIEKEVLKAIQFEVKKRR